MNPLDPREVPTARKRSWPPPSSDVSALAARRDPLHESLATLLRTQRRAGVQAPLAIVSRVVAGMLRRMPAAPVASDAPSDVHGATVILWESLTGRPFPSGVADDHEPPSHYRVGLAPAVDEIVARALASTRSPGFETASEMAVALEAAIHPATAAEIGAWVESLAREVLEEPARLAGSREPSERLPHVLLPPEPIPPAPRVPSIRAELPPPASVVPAQPKVEISLAPGFVGTSKVEVVTRRLRSRPAPALDVKGASKPSRRAVLALAVAGATLLVFIGARCVGERPAAPAAPLTPAVAAASSVETTAPWPPVASDGPAGPSAPAANASAPAAAPRSTASAATSNPPPRAPKAKRAPRISRDDVL